jgi:hypothetical protein
MSIRGYLNSKVRSLEGIIIDAKSSSVQVKGESVCDFNTQPYIYLNDYDDEVPEIFEDMIERFSMHHSIPTKPHREFGIYKFKTAEAVIEHDSQTMISIRANGVKLDDIRNLINMIKTGTLRPKESHEGLQSGKSKQEIEEENRQLIEKLTLIRKYITDLPYVSWWPFIRNSKISHDIQALIE